MATSDGSVAASRFAPLEGGYVEHAAPEAISARIGGLQEKRRKINREINALILLADERHRQIKKGTWPKKATGAAAHDWNGEPRLTFEQYEQATRKEGVMDDAAEKAVEVLTEIAQDTEVEPDTRIRAAATILDLVKFREGKNGPRFRGPLRAGRRGLVRVPASARPPIS